MGTVHQLRILSPHADPVTEIEQACGELYEGLRRKDAARFVAAFDRDTVLFTLAPPLRVGPESLPGVRACEEWFATFDGPIGLEVVKRQVETSGELALVHSLNHLTGRTAGGGPLDLWYRETLGMRRRGGAWKIIHQHQSVPFHMDRGQRAATDLRP